MSEKDNPQENLPVRRSDLLHKEMIQPMRDTGVLSRGGQENPAVLYLTGLRSESGRYQMMRKLDKVARVFGGCSWMDFPWSRLTPEMVTTLVSMLAEQHKPAYVNAILAAIHGVAECAFDKGQMDAVTYRLIRKVKAIRGGSTEPAGRYVNGGERGAIMEACLSDPSPVGRRDAAVLACAYPGGLRRGEIASLTREAITDDGETLSIKVTGKGRKERTVFVGNGGAYAIRDWLECRGDAPGPFSGQEDGEDISSKAGDKLSEPE